MSTEINIHSTTYGFVSPLPCCSIHAFNEADTNVEKAIAQRAQSAELEAGIYIAKWYSYDGRQHNEYVFTVAVETSSTHRVEVEP